MNLTIQEQGDANNYFIVDTDTGKWIASIQMNGELTTPQQLSVLRKCTSATDLYDALHVLLDSSTAPEWKRAIAMKALEKAGV
jgi:hypothetical protein